LIVTRKTCKAPWTK